MLGAAVGKALQIGGLIHMHAYLRPGFRLSRHSARREYWRATGRR